MYKRIMTFSESKCHVKKPKLLHDIGDKISARYWDKGPQFLPLPQPNARYGSKAGYSSSMAPWATPPPLY